MKDRLGRIIYVGKAKSLKKRVSSYFQPSRALTLHPKIRALIEMIADFDTIEVKSEPEALLLEGKLIKQWKPRYNTDFTDDKRFLLVRVDPGEELPRFRLTRIRKDDRSRYFGPFAHSGLLRKTLAQMRRQFGILLGDATPQQLPDGTWQLYDDVRRGTLRLSQHRDAPRTTAARVDEACAFLEGKSREWLETLRGRDGRRGGKAGIREGRGAARRRLRAGEDAREDPAFRAHRSHRRRARTRRRCGCSARRSAWPRRRSTMECFDISHISGTFVVASMVRFADGRPDKDQYRRFQIKSFIGNDDFRAMEEVVGRRYRRLRREGQAVPRPGRDRRRPGQVGAALKAFVALDLDAARRSSASRRSRRRSSSPTGARRSTCRSDHPGLQLLQRLRDEAHRFANTYNADLRSKKIRESLLDDFPGPGPGAPRRRCSRTSAASTACGPLADLFGTMLGLFVFLIWFWLLIVIFGDIFRSRDLGGGAKALWVIFVIFLPFLGVFVYLIARGGKMHERAEQAAQQQQQAFDELRQADRRAPATAPTSCPSWPTSSRRASSPTPSSRPRRPSSSADKRRRGAGVRCHRAPRPPCRLGPGVPPTGG